MRYGLGLFSAIAIAIAAIVPAVASASDRVALIVGNDAYDNLKPLNNPVADAARLAAILVEHGFDVLSCDGTRPGCYNLTREQLNDALEEFEEKADGARVALAFYAGHGLQTADGNVLAPTDIEIACGTWKARREVLLDDVLEAMDGASEKIVILDACRNDPFQAQQCLERGARPLSFGSIAVPDSTSRFLLMTSTLNGQLAQDGLPGAHSPFAEALFHWLEAEPGTQFAQVLDRVTKRVIERTTAANFTQIPEVLIRGGAPESCLVGDGCSSDPEAMSLRKEIEALKAANARNQELAEIGAAFLQSAGSSTTIVSEEDRQRAMAAVIEAGKALAARNDNRAEQALSMLRDGDEAAAEKLFEEVLAARKQRAEAAAEAEAKDRKDAADAARHIAALARPKDLAKAMRYFAQAAELDPTDIGTWMDLAYAARDTGNTAEALRAFREASTLARDSSSYSDRIWAAFGQGDIVMAQGRLDRAEDFYRAAQGLAEKAVAADSGDLDAKRNLAIASERLGNVLKERGRLAQALKSFEKRLEIARELAETDPAYALYQRDLSIAYQKLGDVLGMQGNLTAQLDAYRKNLEIRQTLAANAPSDTTAQSDLGTAEERMGNVLMATGGLKGARAAYQRKLDIVSGIAATDPSNADWQRDLSVAYHKMGKVLLAMGDLPGARDAFQSDLVITEKLAAADPENKGWQRDLAVTYLTVGDVQVAQGDFTGALKSYGDRLAILERLVDSDPENRAWQSDLAAAHVSIGDVLWSRDDVDGALASFDKALGIRSRLAEADPDNTDWLSNLGIAYERLGNVHLDKEDIDAALDAYAKRRDIAARLAAMDETNVTWQRELSVAHYKIGKAYLEAERMDEALAEFTIDLEISERLARTDENNAGWQRDLSISYGQIGDLRKAMDDLEGALDAYQNRVAISERLAKAAPSNIQWQRDWSFGLGRLAGAYELMGERAEARRAFAAGREIAAAVAAVNPEWDALYGDVAWFDARLADLDAEEGSAIAQKGQSSEQ